MTQSSERSPSAQQSPSSRLAAPAEAGQRVDTLNAALRPGIGMLLCVVGLVLFTAWYRGSFAGWF